MDVVSLLLYLLVFGCVVWLALYIIGATLPANVQPPARLVVGVFALVLLVLFLFGRGPFILPPIRR